MGANTWRETVGSGFGGMGSTPTWVVTHTADLESKAGNVQPYSGDLSDLVAQLRQEIDKDVFVFGGADLVTPRSSTSTCSTS